MVFDHNHQPLARVFFACIFAVTALAQAPSPEPPTGSISGVVKDATTRAPLAGVMVNAGGAGASTGPQGQFAFPKVEAGRRWVSVHDESRAASGGTYVLLDAGQEISGIEIYIKLGGTISGKVYDEDRHPVAGAAVLLLEQRFEFGQLAYAPWLIARTDRRGAYQLAPVPAERGFRIMAMKPAKLLDAAAGLPADPDKRPRLPVPAFYPNSRYEDSAQAVTLAPAEDRRDVDIQMPLSPAYCIHGSVEAPDGVALPSVTITPQLALASGWSLTPVTAATADGKFHACGFPPGEYQLAATSQEEARSRRVSAFAQIVIADRDVDEVQLAARLGMTLSGEVVWDPPPRDKAAEKPISITFMKRDNNRRADEVQSRSAIGGILLSGYGIGPSVPGSFTVEPVPAGDYQMDVRRLPSGCYLKEASHGGANILHEPLRLTRGAGDGRMHLTLACDGGSLTARVTDRDGNPVSNVTFYVMPEEAASPAMLNDVLRQEDVEKGWSGTVARLPPGKYLVLASGLDTDGTAQPVLKLWNARSRAKEVSIGPGETAQITLEISDIE